MEQSIGKKIYFWVLVALALALVWFGFSSVAHAALAPVFGYDAIVYPPTLAYSDTKDVWGRSADSSFGFGTLFNISATSTSATDITRIRMWLTKQGTPTDNIYLEIYSGNRDVFIANTSSASSSALQTDSQSGLWDGESRFVDFTLTSPITFTAGTTYWIGTRRTGALDNSNYFYVRNFEENNTSNILGYAGNYRPCIYDGSFSVANDCSGVNQALESFLLYAEVDPIITLDYPTATTTPIVDFTNWVATISNPNTEGTRQQIGVQYWENTSSSQTFYDFQDYSPFVSTSPTPITKTKLLWFPPLTTSTKWIARPFNIVYTSDNSSSTLFTGDYVTFYVNNIDGDDTNTDPLALPNYPSSYESAIGTIFDLAVCPDLDFSSSTLSAIYCISTNFFKETTNTILGAAQSVFSTIGNLVRQVFPINVITHLIDNFNAVASSTPSDIILDDGGNPVVFGGREYVIFTSSTISDFSDNVGFDFRDLFSKIMYAATFLIITFQVVKIIQHLRKDRQGF